MSWTRVQAAVAGGDWFSALTRARSLVRPGDWGQASRVLEWLEGQLGDAAPLSGSLLGQPQLQQWLQDLSLLARGHGRLDPALANAWRLPVPEIGVARFPVVHDGRGILRTLRILPCDGQAGVSGPADATFLRALDLARRAVEGEIRSALGALAQTTTWKVEPALPTGLQLEGGSVGLAAAAAYASFVLRVPVPRDVAFTGALRLDAREVKPADVDDRELQPKVLAFARSDHDRRDLVLRYAAKTTPSGADGVQCEKVAVLWDMLRPLFQNQVWVHQQAMDLHGRAWRTAVARGPATSAEFALLTLLSAAKQAVPEQTLHGLVSDLLQTISADPTPATVHIAALRNSAHVQPLVTATRAGLELREALPPQFDDSAWHRAAHRLLADPRFWSHTSTPLVHAVDQALAGEDTPLGRRCLQDAATQDERTALRALVLLSQDHEARTLRELAPPDDLLPQALLALVAAGLGLPDGLARGALVLAQADGRIEQFLALQALVESVLHLLAVVAFEIGAGPERRRAHLAERVALGVLQDMVVHGVKNPGQGVQRPLLEAVHRFFTEGIELPDTKSQTTRSARLVKLFNDELHDGPALANLVAADAPARFERALQGALPDAIVLIAAVSAAFDHDLRVVSHPDGMRLTSAEGTLGLGQWLRPGDDGGWSFARGKLQGRARRWSYDNSGTTWVPSWPNPAGTALISLDLSTLPTPLAQTVVHLRRASSPAALAGAVDLGLFTLLRLAVGPALAPLLDAPFDKDTASLLRMLHHRGLIQHLAENPRAGGPLGTWLVDGGLERAWWLMAWVQRRQHAVGPLSTWNSSAQAAADVLAALIQDAAQIEVELVAGEQTLVGVTPRVVGPCRDLAWRDPDGQRWPLSPWIEVDDQGRIRLLWGLKTRKSKPGRMGRPAWRTLNHLDIHSDKEPSPTL